MKLFYVRLLKLIIFFTIFELVLFVPFNSISLATNSQTIEATVKMSICGNSIADGGEDCDTEDFKGETCKSLGYNKGTLSCDISCSFEKSKCKNSSSSSDDSDSSDENNESNDSSNLSTSANTLDSINLIEDLSARTVEDNTIKTLPPLVKSFDPNNDGKIDSSESNSVVTNWVNNWRQSKDCDIDKDKECNLKDFSILLFYINS